MYRWKSIYDFHNKQKTTDIVVIVAIGVVVILTLIKNLNHKRAEKRVNLKSKQIYKTNQAYAQHLHMHTHNTQTHTHTHSHIHSHLIL